MLNFCVFLVGEGRFLNVYNSITMDIDLALNCIYLNHVHGLLSA